MSPGAFLKNLKSFRSQASTLTLPLATLLSDAARGSAGPRGRANSSRVRMRQNPMSHGGGGGGGGAHVPAAANPGRGFAEVLLDPGAHSEEERCVPCHHDASFALQVLLYPGASIEGVTFYEKRERVVIRRVAPTAPLSREVRRNGVSSHTVLISSPHERVTVSHAASRAARGRRHHDARRRDDPLRAPAAAPAPREARNGQA